jgi:Holliday junction resolvasome RuvABC DNA-binding subunit
MTASVRGEVLDVALDHVVIEAAGVGYKACHPNLHNNGPKPIIGTATAESLQAKTDRGRRALQKTRHSMMRPDSPRTCAR